MPRAGSPAHPGVTQLRAAAARAACPGAGGAHTAAHPPGPSTAGYTDRAWPNLGPCPGGARSNSRRYILQLSAASARETLRGLDGPAGPGQHPAAPSRIVRTGSLFRADDTRVCVLDPLNALRCLSETVPVAAYPVRHAAPAPAPAGRADCRKKTRAIVTIPASCTRRKLLFCCSAPSGTASRLTKRHAQPPIPGRWTRYASK